MSLYKNKYRVESARLPGWDYSSDGYYFVTICTKDMFCYFGRVVDREMELSSVGRKVVDCWLEIPDHFPFVTVDAFVVMPNHVHGILIINKNNEKNAVETQYLASQTSQVQPNFAFEKRSEIQNTVFEKRSETQNIVSLRDNEQCENKFGPQSQNLGSIVRGFKIGVKKYATLHDINFTWQPRFHDHIIRDDVALQNIRNYIHQNPSKWDKDCFHICK